MTIKPATILCIIIMLFTCKLFAQELSLEAKSIPWAMFEEHYINTNDYKTATSQDKTKTYEAKKATNINGVDFTEKVIFVNKKGLSRISYLANLKEGEVEKTCSNMQDYINKSFGQRTNEVHINKQTPEDYTEVIWTSKLDRTVELFCYASNIINFVSLTISPRWMVLDCTMHSQDPSDTKIEKGRAFFYFDEANEEIRFFNNSYATLPFKSTFTAQRIEFSHNSGNDHTTIDLNSAVIMSKFADGKGHDQLLVGKCKKQ